MKWVKAKLFLLTVLGVWAFLAYSIWYVQLVITLLGLLPVTRLRELSYNFWLWQDQGVNVIASFIVLGRAGNCDVSVSSKLGTLANSGDEVAVIMARIVDILWYAVTKQPNHCRSAIEHDEIHNWGL